MGFAYVRISSAAMICRSEGVVDSKASQKNTLRPGPLPTHKGCDGSSQLALSLAEPYNIGRQCGQGPTAVGDSGSIYGKLQIDSLAGHPRHGPSCKRE